MRSRRILAAVIAAALAAFLPSSAVTAQQRPGGTVLAQAQSAPIVRDITVEGNVEISTDRIMEMIQATRVGEPLDEEKLRQDVNRIAEMGYFEFVRIADPVAFRDGVRITFVVEEFPVIQDVRVTVVDDVVPAESVRELIDVEEGVILNANRLSDSIDPLPTRTWEKFGYVLRVTNIYLDGENFDVLAVEVTPVRVGDITIEGHQKTKEHVIRRELLFQSGDVLSLERVRLSLMRLGQLGYFEPIVPEFLERSGDPLTIDILLPISELKTGRAAFGAVYSSETGLGGYIEVADDNFLGRGEKAGIKWEFSKTKSYYDLSFSEPYLFGSNISAGINLYNTLNRSQAYVSNVAYPYTERKIGGNVTLGRPLGLFTRGSVTLSVENASVTPESEDSEIDASTSRKRSVTATLNTDTTDHLYYPTLGFRHILSVETAGRFLGGDTEFTKYQTSFSKFYKAGSNNQTWAIRALAGFSAGELPLQEQYRLGGSESLRGYKYGEFRGDRMVLAQVEYRFPINESIHGVAFVDAGNAWNDEPIDLGNLKVGYGLGIRFQTPLGMMRIDYGIGEKGGNFYFSLGPSF